MTDSLPRTDSFNTQGRWWDVMTNWIEHPRGLGLVALKLKVSSQDPKSAGKPLSEKRKCQHTMEGAFQGLWWELFYQWERFQLYPTIDNSQSVAMLQSLQVFMRWGKPSSRWKTTRHLELVGSPLKPSNRLRKAHTMAPHSHPEAGERWRNSTWHQNAAVVIISRQSHKDNWKKKHLPI